MDLAGAVPFGIVAFRPGVVLGLRAFSMPILGFEDATCHGKHGSYACHETADLFFGMVSGAHEGVRP